MPEVRGGGRDESLAGVEAEVEAEQLKYARCMRSHQLPDFPDPSGIGGFVIPSAIDQHSSFYESAARACKNLLPGVSGLPGS